MAHGLPLVITRQLRFECGQRVVRCEKRSVYSRKGSFASFFATYLDVRSCPDFRSQPHRGPRSLLSVLSPSSGIQ